MRPERERRTEATEERAVRRTRAVAAPPAIACGGWRETATKAAGGRVSVEHKSASFARASELSAKTKAERESRSGD